MNLHPTLKLVFAIAVAVAGATWGAHEYLSNAFAGKEAANETQTKVEYLLHKSMASLLADINRLEAKKNKSIDDREHLKYLREELERMRAVQKGK